MDVTETFEASRSHLRGVAYRMLGSLSEADDAVQEAWLRLHRSDTSAVANLEGWLTTVVARVCLDMLRSRSSRREDPIDARGADATTHGPDEEAALADSVGRALLVVLDKLAPAERLAFVLHDMFSVPFDEIAEIIGRSPEAARQLASRARRRVQGQPAVPEHEIARHREVVAAFLQALRAGDFEGVVAVLDPDVIVRADGQPAIRGARTWAKGAVAYGHMAAGVDVALVDGAPGLAFAPKGKLVRALRFTIANDAIVEIEIIGDPAHLQHVAVAALDA